MAAAYQLPFSNDDTTMGIMLNGSTNMDYQLLEIGSILEKIYKIIRLFIISLYDLLQLA